MDRSYCTLDDVAKLAKVAKSTASMALRNDTRIAAKTRQRVQEAAQKLGYQPDPVMSAFSSRRFRNKPHSVLSNLAVLIDDRWYDFPSLYGKPVWLETMIEGLNDAAQRMGYSLIPLRLRRDLLAHQKPDRLMEARGIKGIILTTHINKTMMTIPLDLKRYSIICAGLFSNESLAHQVRVDSFAVVDIACRQVSEAGYKRIGLAHGMSSELRTGTNWLGSYAKEIFLKRYSSRFIPPHLPVGYPDQAFYDWIDKYRPDAIITNDTLFFEAIQKKGLRVPEDIGVAFINHDFCEIPDVAGISQRYDLVGEKTIEQMHFLLQKAERGLPQNPHDILIKPEWVHGRTI
ncbi:MAG: LacI family DNA-binding transcriptional regulator [Verrucomicrobiota bacterium JB024]|nr:LacI family DNA-binding transcriptional regulator [Verrucomicrobiota bacterium JB024]